MLCNLNLAHAEMEHIIYLGSGKAKSGDLEFDGKPFSIGYLLLLNNTSFIFGVDVSKEGTMLNSTWGQTNALDQATSFNLLLGRNLTKNEKSRFDTALIMGTREKTASCPRSYLGYQCYANQSPDTTYDFNYGALLAYSYSSALVGLRVTGESTQGILGLRF